MVCPSCNSPAAQPGARFCSECGARLAGSGAQSIGHSGRRQLTALFCDIARSMDIAERMDTEDFRDILLSYRDRCSTIIKGHRGHVARFVGDGILAHFGFPIAREDDVRLAVHAALGICQDMPELGRDVEARYGIRLAVRIGVHTGLVVIDEDAASLPQQEHGVMGNSLSIGARLQEMAPPDGVVISHDTFQLVQGHFIVETLGMRRLKGVPRDMLVYRVIEPSSARSIFEARAASGLSPMIDRIEPYRQLLQEWALVRQGMARTVLISGEPGIGKSRLLHEVQRHLAQENVVQITCACTAHYQDTAFHPIAGELARIFAFERADDRQRRLDKIRAGLQRVGIDDRRASERMALIFAEPTNAAATHRQAEAVVDTQARQEAIETLVRYVSAVAARVPLLLIFEDLQWSDPSTLEFLSHLCRSLGTAPVLVLASHRSDSSFDLAAHSSIELDRIAVEDCHALVRAVATARLPAGIAEQLVERTDGVPLFIEELTKAAQEALELAVADPERGTREEPSVVPASLQDSLMARLDRLGRAKEVAQVASAIGRTFRLDLLSALWADDRPALGVEIGRLTRAGLIFQRFPADAEALNTWFEFKHELVREVAYESLLRTTRRAIHARIATTLEEQFPHQGTRHPELLAYHFSRAGMIERALPLWEDAGRRAIASSANQEAIAHLSRALELLELLPESHATRVKELDLHLAIAAPLMAGKGYGAPELDRTVSRAMTLSEQVGDPSQVFPLIYGRWSFQQVTGQIWQSLDLAQRLVETARVFDAPEPRMIAYRLLGTSLLATGAPEASAAALQSTLAMFDADQHTILAYRYGADIKVMTLCSLALVQWLLGRDGSARRSMDAARTRALQLGHSNTLAYSASHWLALLTFGDDEQSLEQAVAAFTTLALEQGLPFWLAVSKGYVGCLHLRRGEVSSAVLALRDCLGAMQAINAVYWQATVWMWLGEACGKDGKPSEAETAFERSKTLMIDTGECWLQPELYRVWANTRLALGAAGADDLLRESLRVADAQGAIAWSARAARDLARYSPVDAEIIELGARPS